MWILIRWQSGHLCRKRKKRIRVAQNLNRKRTQDILRAVVATVSDGQFAWKTISIFNLRKILFLFIKRHDKSLQSQNGSERISVVSVGADKVARNLFTKINRNLSSIVVEFLIVWKNFYVSIWKNRSNKCRTGRKIRNFEVLLQFGAFLLTRR